MSQLVEHQTPEGDGPSPTPLGIPPKCFKRLRFRKLSPTRFQIRLDVPWTRPFGCLRLSDVDSFTLLSLAEQRFRREVSVCLGWG